MIPSMTLPTWMWAALALLCFVGSCWANVVMKNEDLSFKLIVIGILCDIKYDISRLPKEAR